MNRARSWACVLVAVAALTAGCSSSSSSTGTGPGGGGSGTSAVAAKAPRYPAGTATNGALPASISHLAFTDQDGKTVHLADLAGKTVMVQDVMTLCQELCPIDTSTFVQTAEDYAKTASDPADTVFLSITVDPQRDTPTQLAAYRKLYVGKASHLPQWRLLTGSPADVAALWKYLGVFVKRVPQDEKVDNWRTGVPLTYDIQHSDQAFFFDASGDERYILDGMPSLGGAPVPAVMQRFMSADGHHNETKKSGWTADQALGVLSWLEGSKA